MTEGGREAILGSGRVIWGPSGDQSWRSILGSILRSFWSILTLSQETSGNLKNCLLLAVGRALRLNTVKYGSWDGWVVVPGIAPPRPTQSPTPGTPLPTMPAVSMTSVLPRGTCRELNSAVGLKSVVQLSLDDRFSGFLSITEVYNLSGIDRINNHSVIPGFD